MPNGHETNMNFSMKEVAETIEDSEIHGRHIQENRDWFFKLNSEVREIKEVLKAKFNIDIDNIIYEKFDRKK